MVHKYVAWMVQSPMQKDWKAQGLAKTCMNYFTLLWKSMKLYGCTFAMCSDHMRVACGDTSQPFPSPAAHSATQTQDGHSDLNANVFSIPLAKRLHVVPSPQSQRLRFPWIVPTAERQELRNTKQNLRKSCSTRDLPKGPKAHSQVIKGSWY